MHPSGIILDRQLLITPLSSSPTKELTLETASLGLKSDPPHIPLELTLDNGQKYLLAAWGWHTRTRTLMNFGPAGIQTGKIGKTKIAIFDSNVDGFYTLDKDGIVVGELTPFDFGEVKCHKVQPLSKYISTPDGIFEIQNLAKDGSELTVLPYRGPTASLEVIAPKNYVGQIILSSDTGLNVIVSGKAGDSVTVIPGDYMIQIGTLDATPQGPQMRLWGYDMSVLNVEAGTKQVMRLSGPKTLEFKAELIDNKINISTNIRTKGSANEHYDFEDGYDQENLPEVYLHVDGQSTFLGKMEFG